MRLVAENSLPAPDKLLFARARRRSTKVAGHAALLPLQRRLRLLYHKHTHTHTPRDMCATMKLMWATRTTKIFSTLTYTLQLMPVKYAQECATRPRGRRRHRDRKMRPDIRTPHRRGAISHRPNGNLSAFKSYHIAATGANWIIGAHAAHSWRYRVFRMELWGAIVCR